jgi:hypothetical protein
MKLSALLPLIAGIARDRCGVRNRAFSVAFTARIDMVRVKEQSHAARRQICLYRQAKASG